MGIQAFEPTNSSQIEHASYDDGAKRLRVRFKGKLRTYTYLGVPPHVFEALTKHSSPGKYFHAVIRRHYGTEN